MAQLPGTVFTALPYVQRTDYFSV